MKKVLKTVLFILGAPLILAMIAYSSIVIFERGITYSFWPFVGLILGGVLCIVYIIVFLITGRKAKKTRKTKNIVRGTIALALVAFILTSGLWMVIDKVLPDILADATSDTILFDDLREDYIAHAITHGDLLDNFVMMNYDIENLTWKNGEYSEEERAAYVKEGYKNPRVKELISANFLSIDGNGYATFVGPWISFADGGRMTIPTLIHLIVNKREGVETAFLMNFNVTPSALITAQNPNPFSDKEERDPNDDPVSWSVLDMQGGEMGFELGDLLSGLDMDLDMIIDLLVAFIGDDLKAVLGSISEALAEEDVVGAPLYLQLDLSDKSNPKFALASSTVSRGVHGYMHTAWLNSNDLLFAVISLFPVRAWLYILGAWLMFTSVAVGALRYSQYADDKDEFDEVEEEEAVFPPRQEPYNNVRSPRYQPPINTGKGKKLTTLPPIVQPIAFMPYSDRK